MHPLRPRASRARGFLVLLACLAALLADPGTTSGQHASASIRLTVVDGATNRPLASAQVLLGGRGVGLTDSNGGFLLRDLPAEEFLLEVRFLGYASRSVGVTAAAGRNVHLTIPLEVEPVVLSEVRVEAEAARSAALREFYRRVRTGAGQYITRADIERRRPRDLTELFRMLPGVDLRRTSAGDVPIMEAKGSALGDLLNEESRECAIQYFLDGSPIKPIHNGVLAAEVSLGEIEGIEVYRRGSIVPAKYHRLHNNCGVILIWKRER